MGIGDNLLGSGMARGAAARGKRIAFGDGRRIYWDNNGNSELIFRGNPNIAHPRDRGADDLEWIDFRTGHRLYNRMSPGRNRWIWNMQFRAVPGELFFSESERAWAAGVGSGFVLVEPNVPSTKTWTANKQWGSERYNAVADSLARDMEVVQFVYPGARNVVPNARLIRAPSIRHAFAALAQAALYIGPEGGMHHGAAAVGVPGVVLFGGFIPPKVTGYAGHANLIGSAKEFCGSLQRCSHCRKALDAITVEEVVDAAHRLLAPADALEVA